MIIVAKKKIIYVTTYVKNSLSKYCVKYYRGHADMVNKKLRRHYTPIHIYCNMYTVYIKIICLKA